MKAISKVLACVTLLGVLFTSCSEDSDKTPVAPAGKLIATVNGTAWESDGEAIIDNNSIYVGGQSGSNAIGVVVYKDDVVGSYDVKGIGELTTYTPEAMVAYSQGSDASASIYFDNEVSVGSVTITEIDQVNKTVSGTFHSKVQNYNDGTIIEVTNGSFTKIPYSTELPASTMSAKIDGVQFNSGIAISARESGLLVLNGQTLGGQQIITLYFPETINTGTYTIGGIGDSDYWAMYTKNGNSNVSVSGTLKITAHDKTAKHIEGTFNFIAEPFVTEGPNVTVTEGAFAIDYE